LSRRQVDGNQGKKECEEAQAAKGKEGKEEIGNERVKERRSLSSIPLPLSF